MNVGHCSSVSPDRLITEKAMPHRPAGVNIMRRNDEGLHGFHVTPFVWKLKPFSLRQAQRMSEMINFRGFNDWIEIFQGGFQKAADGRKHDGTKLMERAISKFNPLIDKVPIVIGHPKENATAYGWISDLKKAGNRLYAKFSDVVPEFEAAVKKGRYKKRSVSFGPDGSILHVGFLGAMPPAVKGLTDLSFDEGTFSYHEFRFQTETETNIMKFEFIQTFPAETLNGSIDPGMLLHKESLKIMSEPPQFSEDGEDASPDITYGEAFRIAQVKYPDVAHKYKELLGI
jgi:hypothetical protein